MPVSRDMCKSPRPGTEATTCDVDQSDKVSDGYRAVSQNLLEESKIKTAGAVAEPVSEEGYEEIFDAVMERVQREEDGEIDQEASSENEDADKDAGMAHKVDSDRDDEHASSDNEDDDQSDQDNQNEEPEHDQDEHVAQFRNLQTPTFDDTEEGKKTPPRLSQRKPKMVNRKRRQSDNAGKQPSRKLAFSSPTERKKKLLRKTKSSTSVDEPSKKMKRLQQREKKKRLQQRDIQETGVWVQCMNKPCMKWRYLTDVTDPAQVPDFWNCDMSTDPLYNNCEAPEQDYQSLEFVFNTFTEGSIVWAKMGGYPWWPAMVEEDPDYGIFVELDEENKMPVNYHVVFLDQTVSRAWLNPSCLRKYDEDNPPLDMALSKSYTSQVNKAKLRAREAMSMSIPERVKKFGFSHTFKGVIADSESQKSQGMVETEFLKINNRPEDEHSNHSQLAVDEILDETEALLNEAQEVLSNLDKSSQELEDSISKRKQKTEESISKVQKKRMKQKKKEEKKKRREERAKRREEKRKRKVLVKSVSCLSEEITAEVNERRQTGEEKELKLNKEDKKKVMEAKFEKQVVKENAQDEKRKSKEQAKLEKQAAKEKAQEEKKKLKEQERIKKQEEQMKLKEQAKTEKKEQKEKLKEEKKKLKEQAKLERKETLSKQREEKKLMDKLCKLDNQQKKIDVKNTEKEKCKEEKRKLKEQRKLEKKKAKEEKKKLQMEGSTEEVSQQAQKRKLEQTSNENKSSKKVKGDEALEKAEVVDKKEQQVKDKRAIKSKSKEIQHQGASSGKSTKKPTMKAKPSGFKPPSKVIPTFGAAKQKSGFRPPVQSSNTAVVKSTKVDKSDDENNTDNTGDLPESVQKTESIEDTDSTSPSDNLAEKGKEDNIQDKVKTKKSKFNVKRQTPAKEQNVCVPNQQDEKTALHQDQSSTKKSDAKEEADAEEAECQVGNTVSASSGKDIAEGTGNEAEIVSPDITSEENGKHADNYDNDSDDFDMDWPENPVSDVQPESVSEKARQLLHHPSQDEDSQPFDLMEE